MPYKISIVAPIEAPDNIVKAFKIPPAPQKAAFSDIPVDVGPQYEGQRVRTPEMYVELGGPKVAHKFELFRVRRTDEIEDGEVVVVGPDVSELSEGSSNPYAVIIEAAGSKLEPQAEGVLERRIHEFSNYIQGYMHLNQRYDIWLRISKRSYQKGLNSFRYIGTVLYRLFKSAFPVVEKMRIVFVTEPKVVELLHEQALKVYDERDRRALGLRDEDVDMFYSCKLCQSFAPTHACIITPERPSACGAITWLDARVAALIDPKGPIQPVPKGRVIDPVAGEYDGVNEIMKKLSNGTIQRIRLYALFDYPPTICGCFEIATFYIPEIDAVGLVHRGFTGVTPIGLRFGQVADAVGGGKQVPGFQGIGLLYLRSRKLFQADGGWNRVVWMPSELKQRILDAIPPELKDKIATEKEVTSIESLKKFLIEKKHPIAEKLQEKETRSEAKEEKPAKKAEGAETPMIPPSEQAPQPPLVVASHAAMATEASAQQQITSTVVPTSAGNIVVTVSIPMQPQQKSGSGVSITLKGVKIRAEKLVIKKTEGERR
ncbi:MAG: CO dehydrogenase/CO-methylating acetyl-CoA synthase complex subunit beta [Ignisphaera sp.]|nr:CO dehydrogenase/CO-methylating acetyl-CoA synthase complex subunit beta [Ignisphaera sp.]MCX8168303.1 CO dehydrogenase/CO-methylating acetyl-CoA synthase complex subunit beta [Ignisphaera sp.]MDW8085877.1 CO dehydrogenase/CO-methylating acetyl-CoA synthase complex subunit beta [Ignisphaera sp.]